MAVSLEQKKVCFEVLDVSSDGLGRFFIFLLLFSILFTERSRCTKCILKFVRFKLSHAARHGQKSRHYFIHSCVHYTWLTKKHIEENEEIQTNNRLEQKCGQTHILISNLFMSAIYAQKIIQ